MAFGSLTGSSVPGSSASTDWKESCRAATTAALAANTYDNGTAGVGATLTANANGALAAIDGVTLIANDRILVQDEATGANNGIYVVTQVGSAGTPYILTRATDANSSSNISSGMTTFIEEGTVNGNLTFTLITDNPITVGTTALVFTMTGGAGDVVGPASSTDNALVRFDGTTGKLIQNSSTTLDDNGLLTMQNPINEFQGVNIASATTTNIGAATGNYVNITGTTQIDAFDTIQAGTRRILRFQGALQLTYNATSMILPTAANITTAADDTATFVSLGSGNWICTQYQRANGTALAGGSAVQDIFTVAANLISNQGAASDVTADDFLVGSTALNDTGNAAHDRRFFFDKSQASFRAGQATGTQWDTRGDNSFAVGLNCTASGTESFAGGDGSTASGAQSLAFGRFCTASGTQTVALGDSAVATGADGVAIGGTTNVASGGTRGTALGNTCNVTASDGMALGRFCTSSASQALVFGTGTGSGTRLDNSTANSIFFGANSTVPSLSLLDAGGTGAFGEVRISGYETHLAISPPQITANQNNYSGISTKSFARLSSDASRNITGITGGTDGRILLITNVGSFNIVFTDQDASSTAANRIITGTGTSLTLAPTESIQLRYDATTAMWKIVGYYSGNNYRVAPIPPVDLTGSGMIATVTVDTNAVGIGAGLYLASDGNYDEADAGAASTMPCTAIALETSTGSKKVLLRGFVRNDAWNWTVGGLIYVSTTQGTFTQTAPSGTGETVQVVGVAQSADVIYFNPSFSMVVVA